MCHAAHALPNADLSEQRHLFQEAEQAIKAGHMDRYRQLSAKLDDYPLQPYLKYSELRQRLRSTAPEEIRAFLSNNADTPIAILLHHRWLRTLAQQHRWQELVNNYYLTNDRYLQCRYAHALYQIGQTERAHIVVENLWLTGRSLPRACDAPIDSWREAGKLSDDLIWKRINLAIQSGHIRLALYLADYLPESQRFWVNIWSKIRREPEYLREVNDHFQNVHQPVLRWITVYGLTRLARRDPARAAEYWTELKPVYDFTEQEQERVERRLSLALARQGDAESYRWLEKLDLKNERSEVQAIHILSAIQDRDWESALDWLNQLSPELQHSERWRYWRGRVLEGLGRFEEARAIYNLTADNRSYYSFLAADRAGNRYQFTHRPLLFSNDELQDLRNIPALLRAGELYALNRVADARREWNYAMGHMSKSQLLKAAKLADEWGWHDRAIMTLAQAKYWDDLELRFPLAHQKTVVKQAQRQNINPAWAFAVIRQESAFTTDARSNAGALGLMQLLPRTARYVARTLRIRMHGQRDLLDADTNIELGVRYLRRVKERFDGHPVLATAAYNAGATNVRRWLPTESTLPADLWVEMVPFHETRDYLKRVLTYTVIYEQRLGQQPVPLLDRMPPVPSNPDVTLSQTPRKKRDS
jgi:soluble lytic murein transglycosylase